MSLIKELLDTIPQIGQVQWIGIRPKKRGEVHSVDQISIDLEKGIIGDHYAKKGGKRMVTLIQSEHIDAMAKMLKKDAIDPTLLRRNIVVSGINLLSLHKRQFQIGSAILECTGHCHPCSRMETNLGPGGYNIMRGHGGLTATVIQGGEVQLGDEVKLIIQ